MLTIIYIAAITDAFAVERPVVAIVLLGFAVVSVVLLAQALRRKRNR